MPIKDSFAFWTNKGGVGKTTMCFHSAVTFAKAFPDTTVIVVDCDPQASISATMLTQLQNPQLGIEKHAGFDRVKELENGQIQGRLAKTLLGVLLGYIQNANAPAKEFLVDTKDHNTNLPVNMKLLCGDTRLNCIEGQLVANASGPVNQWDNPYSVWRSKLKFFLDEAAKEISGDVYVFIDTNPAWMIFTEMAILAATKMVIPVMADEYSSQALSNMFYLLYGLNKQPGESVLQSYEAKMFFAKAKEYKMVVPKIQTVIQNKCAIRSNAAGGQKVGAFEAVMREQNDILFKIMKRFEDGRETGYEIKDVFNLAGYPIPTDAEGLSTMFSCWMRDMVSGGVITSRAGLPFWAVKRNAQNIQNDVQAGAPSTSVRSSMTDFVGFSRAGRGRATEAEPTSIPVMDMLLWPEKLSDETVNMFWKEFQKTATQAFGSQTPSKRKSDAGGGSSSKKRRT